MPVGVWPGPQVSQTCLIEEFGGAASAEVCSQSDQGPGAIAITSLESSTYGMFIVHVNCSLSELQLR